MQRALRWYDTLIVNVYFLGLTTLSQTLGLVFPLLVQQFIGEDGKATFFGNLRLWTLMTALLVQAAMGMVSDRSRGRWGRRRPFILGGTLLDLVFIALVGFSIGLEGTSGYWFLLAVAILLSVSSNVAHSAQQGLIPDLVPEDRRGRFSAVKAMLEIPLPLLLVSFTIARLIGAGNMVGALLLAAGVLLVTMLLTMLVPERTPENEPPPLDWSPFLRLLLMTALFTAIILGMGQLVIAAGRFLNGVAGSYTLVVLMGVIGLGAMLVAIGIGVGASVRLSLGDASNRNPSYTWWVINRLAFLVGTVNLSSFALFYLQARLGFVREQAAQPAAFLMLLVGLFILASALPSGWLADRFGHKRLVIASGLVAALGTLVAIAVPSLVFIYVGGCLIGLATGVFFTANWALGTELVPKEEAGRYLGLSNLAGAGAGAVGAYIGGPIADYFATANPDVPGIGYVLLFAIYGTLFLFSVLAAGQVRVEPAGRPSLDEPIPPPGGGRESAVEPGD
jgi:MFS family permease